MKDIFARIAKAVFGKSKPAARILLALLGVFTMGASMSVIEKLKFGTDPFTCMNIGISSVTHLSLGTVSLLVSLLLFIFVIFADAKQIGLGTLFNMVGFGYTIDLFRWMFRKIGFTGVEDRTLRVLLLCGMLCIFILAVSVYLAADLGSAPYDATPVILADRLRIRFPFVRIFWDVTAVVIGWLLGSTVGVTTVVCALLVGPIAAWVRRVVDRILA